MIVAIDVHERDAGSVLLHFAVRDTGVGLSDEQRRRLFQAFVQAEASTARRFGGSGLGLVICQHLVRMMGGAIGVDSAPGQGSTFRFSARFGVPAAAVYAAPEARLEPLRGRRVLVVDDNAAARAILVTMVRRFGLVVDAVADMEAALQAAGASRYDAVLLDAGMAEGVDGARRLAEQSEPVPCALMATAYARDGVLQRVAQARVRPAAMLAKPVTPAALLETLCALFGLAGAATLAPAAADGRETPAESPLRGARVLLVEDNEINQELASELLAGVGVVVTIAADGRAALDVLEREAFDAVLMDCQMPVMDGYAATRALRQRPELKDLPVLAMTASAMLGDRERALAAGMNDHVVKPIQIDAMFSTLARWVKLPGSRMNAP